jgi:hypothetical protein
MSTQNICTPQELKKFADSTELTIDNLSKFIAGKTNQKHLIIQRELVKDLNKQLFDNTVCIFDINRFLNEVWDKVVSTNRATTDKWKESLELLESR